MKWNCNVSLYNLLYTTSNLCFYNKGCWKKTELSTFLWLIIHIEYSMLTSTHHTLAGNYTREILTGGNDIRVLKEKPFACLDCWIVILWETSCDT